MLLFITKWACFSGSSSSGLFIWEPPKKETPPRGRWGVLSIKLHIRATLAVQPRCPFHACQRFLFFGTKVKIKSHIWKSYSKCARVRAGITETISYVDEVISQVEAEVYFIYIYIHMHTYLYICSIFFGQWCLLKYHA